MILLICDHPKRELETLLKLKIKINNSDIACKIINKSLVLQAYNRFKPKIITLPHCINNFYETINVLSKKTELIILPSESCGFVDKFIDMQYCNIFHKYKKKSNHKKVDYFFTQSKYTSDYLKKKNLIKKNSINTGFLYFNYWNEKKYKKNKKNKIGIALTNEIFTRYFRHKDFIENYRNSNKISNYLDNSWRLKQFNLDLYYLALIFRLIKKIPDNYEISFRSHPLDTQTQWKKILDNRKNLKVENKKNIYKWVNEQDLIISTFSGISMDSYVFEKPHISLVNMIPNEFINFDVYNSHKYKIIGDKYSKKPKNFDELITLIKKIKFKKNNKYKKDLLKYYDYPYKEAPLDSVYNNLLRIYENKRYKYKSIDYSKKQKMLRILFGKNIGSYLIYKFSETKLYFNRFNHSNYYPLHMRFLLNLLYKIYRFFYK